MMQHKEFSMLHDNKAGIIPIPLFCMLCDAEAGTIPIPLFSITSVVFTLPTYLKRLVMPNRYGF